MSTIAEIRNSLGGPSTEYRAKQLHAVPESPVVQREPFILERCAGKVVLDIGASGPMHESIVRVASKCYGIEKPGGPGMSDVVRGDTIEFIDLDDYHQILPIFSGVEIIICGEVLEHLSNPGWFLTRLRKAYNCPLIITVPNAFGEAGRRSLERGIENCNIDHIAWHSHRTIKTLLNRHGYGIIEFYWYGRNGQRPKFSEGLIVVTE